MLIIQGTLIGTIIDYATSTRPDRSSYLIPLGIIYVMPFFLALGMFFIPESPRWLILQGRVDEGRKALQWLRPDGVKIEAELAEIKDAIARERAMGSDVGVRDMFKHPTERRRTFLSIFAITTQAASGSMFVICEHTPVPKSESSEAIEVTHLPLLVSIQGLLLHHGAGAESIRDELRAQHSRPDSSRSELADHCSLWTSSCAPDDRSFLLRHPPVNHCGRIR